MTLSPTDFKLGVFTHNDASSARTSSLFATDDEGRIFEINAPASFALGTAVIRGIVLTDSTSDVSYSAFSETPTLLGLTGHQNALSHPQQIGGSADSRFATAQFVDVYFGGELNPRVVRRYNSSAFNVTNSLLTFIGTPPTFETTTPRDYTSILGFNPNINVNGSVGTVASENKIYIVKTDFGNAGATFNLQENSNFLVLKRVSDKSTDPVQTTEYIDKDGIKYQPEGSLFSLSPNIVGDYPTTTPEKVLDAVKPDMWICSKKIFKISLVNLYPDFTDNNGVLRKKGEVLVEGSFGGTKSFAPVSLATDKGFIDSDGSTYSSLDWICMYVGCTDGVIRYICTASVQAVDVTRDRRGLVWVSYEAFL